MDIIEILMYILFLKKCRDFILAVNRLITTTFLLNVSVKRNLIGIFKFKSIYITLLIIYFFLALA
jgi:hypothetical protein